MVEGPCRTAEMLPNTADMGSRTAPVELAPRVWWVGEILSEDNFQCHVYLIEQGDQSVLIDPGSALVADGVAARVDEIVGLENVAWVVLSHADPDVVGALPRLLEIGLSRDAQIVTHWRDNALLKHFGWGLRFWLIDQHDWKLSLDDRTLHFVLTPYAHFAGAFCTYDERERILFSSDMFGAFSDDDHLFAELDDSLAGLREFHEHYMPSREAVTHAIDEVNRFDIRMIAPQHGKILPAAVIPRAEAELRDLECGLYLDVSGDPGLDFLFQAHRTMQELSALLFELPMFDVVARHLDGVAAELMGAVSFSVYATAGANTLVFDRADDFAGRVDEPPEVVQEVFQHRDAGIRSVGKFVVVPWTVSTLDHVDGCALVELPAPVATSRPQRKLLGEIAELSVPVLQRTIALREAESERSRLSDQVDRDRLTGLYNRHYFDRTAPIVFEEAVRDRTEVALIMVDIDHFKVLNDTYGHLAGDDVLRRTAQRMCESLRSDDRAIRFGGEEFVVVAQGVSRGTARALGERIRRAVAAPVDDCTEVTVSVGVAVREPGESVTQVLERADAALYAAKDGGRNQVCMSQGEHEPVL